MTIFRNFIKIVRHFCTKPPLRHIQVCILGADTPLGNMLSLLFKQNPTISGLHLQGTSRVESIGLDLSHFDTRCKVKTYFDADSVNKSVKVRSLHLKKIYKIFKYRALT